MTPVLIYLLRAFMLAALAPLMVGVIRKFKASYQGRYGASVLQPYRDLRKLFAKDEVIPEDASWLFYLTPYIVFGTALSVAAAVPIMTLGTTGVLGDLFVFIYTLGIGTFFLVLAGIDSGSSFGGFGSSRDITFSAIAEGVLMFSLLPLAVLAGSTNLGDVGAHIAALSFTELLPVVVAFVGFFIALLAENARIPVDNPATHLELTMVHEAMILEYSGTKLALLEWASALKLMVFTSIVVSVFIPWGMLDSTTDVRVLSFMATSVIFLVKCALVAFVIATIESTLAKLRIFRIPRLLFSAFIMGAVALALTII